MSQIQGKTGKYTTRQKALLLEYFEDHPGRHATAAEICAFFQEAGTPVSRATVYRQLEHLVEEGTLEKFYTGGSSPACFAMNPAESPPVISYHCVCEKCGRLIHLRCQELEQFQEHLKEEHHFAMNRCRTVFYGVCEECMR